MWAEACSASGCLWEGLWGREVVVVVVVVVAAVSEPRGTGQPATRRPVPRKRRRPAVDGVA